MAKITVKYCLSNAGQKTSLLAGGDGKSDQVVEVEATAENLALASVSADGKATIRSYVAEVRQGGFVRSEFIYADRLLTGEEAVEALLSAQSALAAKIVAEEAGELTRWLAEAEDYVSGAPTAKYPGTHKRASADILARLDVEYDRRKAAEKASDAKRIADREAEVAAKEKEKQEEVAGMEAWVREHGSERLRLALENGLLGQSVGIYLDERLTGEWPGWESDKSHHHDDVLNPSLAELKTLASAKAAHPAASDDILLVDAVMPADDEYEESDHEHRVICKVEIGTHSRWMHLPIEE